MCDASAWWGRGSVLDDADYPVKQGSQSGGKGFVRRLLIHSHGQLMQLVVHVAGNLVVGLFQDRRDRIVRLPCGLLR